jgi:hypothetical protein
MEKDPNILQAFLLAVPANNEIYFVRKISSCSEMHLLYLKSLY